MLKTLAAKHKSTVSAMARNYKTAIDTPDGPRTCFQATAHRDGKRSLVARFGGIPLKRKRIAVLADRQPIMSTRHNELILRLLAEKCELCEARDGLQVHHVRKTTRTSPPSTGHRLDLLWWRLPQGIVALAPAADEPGASTPFSPPRRRTSANTVGALRQRPRSPAISGAAPSPPG